VACVAAVGGSPALASDRVYFAAVDNITNALVQRINAETVRIDMSAWYLTERTISIALVNRLKAGVPVRLIGDRVAIFETDPNTRREFYWLASQGVPIRLRYHPTWYPEIDHWKATIFAGQKVVSFGSANYTPFELAPFSSVNYKDEVVLFSDDIALVNAFKTKFDRYWNDSRSEPESAMGSPPYFRNWNDACASESACSDYKTLYPNPAPMIINTARLEPDYALPSDMVWGQGPSFNNRLVQEINAEPTRVDFIVYRLTVDNITEALLSKFRSGVPVRVIIEPNEYSNRRWPEYWITHANVDKLWAAGIPIKKRLHDGLTHMKVLITSRVATIASSNFAAAWQRDHNYFVPAAIKPTIHQTLKNRFQTMWNDPVAFTQFQPLPPDPPVLAAPATTSTGLTTTPTLSWQRAAFAVSYDVYLGTASSPLSRVANVPAQISNSPPASYSWRPGTALQGGTTYFWKVVSRTNATAVNSSIVASSPTWSFTTAGISGGTPPPPPPTPPPGNPVPSPWQSRDIGAVGQPGTASYSNGVFTIRGAGADIWNSSDSFHYVSQPLSGNGEIVARVTGIQATHTWAKAGVMIRETLSSNSAHALLNLTPAGTIEFLARSSTGASTAVVKNSSHSAPVWLKLVRSASTVTGFVSSNGSSWTPLGSTTLSIGSSANVGLAVTSHNTSILNTSTFDSVRVTTGSVSPPPPPPASPNVVIYASDIPASALHGWWSRASDATSPSGVKLVTTNVGVANTTSPLAAPSDYVDVTFNANAGTAYRIWLRLQALNNDKSNDAVWVQFSDALVNGAPAYRMNTSSGLLVNLATDSTAASLNRWGWQNGAYWLSQPTVVSFATSGSRTLRIQVREDGVQLDQIVLSPGTYLNAPPGTVSNDATIVPKP
jgi:hypothetical protein